MDIQHLQRLITVLLVVLLVAAVSYFTNDLKQDYQEFEESYVDCGLTEEKRVMHDHLMRGVLEKGKEYKVIVDFYKCNPPKKGDLVLYRISKTIDPVVKRVHAVEGDKFKVVKDTKQNNWKIMINGEYVKYRDRQFYHGNATALPPLGLYERSYQGVLKEGHLILLSTVPPGGMDSATMGVSSVNDLIGKVELL